MHHHHHHHWEACPWKKHFLSLHALSFPWKRVAEGVLMTPEWAIQIITPPSVRQTKGLLFSIFLFLLSFLNDDQRHACDPVQNASARGEQGPSSQNFWGCVLLLWCIQQLFFPTTEIGNEETHHMLVPRPVMDCFVFTTLEADIVFILKSVQAGCNIYHREKKTV